MEKCIEVIQTAMEELECASLNSKIKHVKRESPYIHQKILDLQTSTQRNDQEIYGDGLLDAINEFENFVAKNWGRNQSDCKERQNMLQPLDHNNNRLTQRTASTSTSLLMPKASKKEIPFFEEHQQSCPSQCTTMLNNRTNEYDVCKLCQRACPCKISSVVEQDDQSTLKVNTEFSSKAVNTDIEFIIHHADTATNTVSTETGLEPTFTARSEQLSKLTIPTQTLMTQDPDSGGEGNTPTSIGSRTNNKEMKCASSENFLVTVNSSSSTLLQDDSFSHDEEEDSSCSIYPTEDMNVALKQVNEALLHGRTGREIAASVSVILNEWFLLVGSKTARANDVSNYLNTFQTYSPQLLRYMVNIPNNVSGITALHYAVSYGNYPVVAKLLDTNMVDPNKANKAGYTSIMLASIAHITSVPQEQTIRKLISLGDVNIKAAQHGQTALMLAASNGNFRMVKLLLEAGANVNAQDEDGSTALMCAVEHGHADIVQCLLAQPGCEPNLTDNDGLTALNVAMEAGHKDIAVLLYAHMHFGNNGSATSTLDNQLLFSKRSKSTANASSFMVDNKSKCDRKSDSYFVARKQHSSIN